jgi:hypothetical protein
MIRPSLSQRFPRYPELHYAPLGRRLSRLWQPWPELFLDLPWRVDAGRPLPLLAVWADARRFPVRLLRLELTLVSPRGQVERRAADLDLRLDGQVGGAVLERLVLEGAGLWQVWADVELERLPGGVGVAGQRLRFRNQLAPGLPEDPLTCRVDAAPPPRLPGLVACDIHVHSSATRDMVEFGPPPDLLREAAAVLGVDAFALTDHSYDLDDAPDDWSRNDPSLPVWHAQQEWIRAANATPGPFVLDGEECSVGGDAGGVLHLLLLHPPQFVAGSADGGEGVWPRRPEWRLSGLLEALEGSGCLPVAAHSAEVPGRSERWLLRRRAWSADELRRVPALQALSGGRGPWRDDALAGWVDCLRAGGRPTLLAGSDSHGAFSLDRRVRRPLWRLEQDAGRRFGDGVSHVLLPAPALSPPAGGADPRAALLLDEMRAGRVMTGNGPLLAFVDAAERVALGGPVAGGGALRLRAWLPEACGPAGTLRVLAGSTDGERERLVVEIQGPSREIVLKDPWSRASWLRAELRMPGGWACTGALLPPTCQP